MKASDARKDMAPQEMADVIRSAPPTGWPDGWAGWDCTRDAHILLMRERMAHPKPKPAFAHKRGIVVSVNAKPGNSSGKELRNGYFPGAYVTVKELRRLGCTLPITFAYLGHVEWDPYLTRLMKPYGVECMDLRKTESRDPRKPRILSGWESKAYAIQHAPYEQVMYLDADCVPLHDPSYLFDSEQFRCGAIFWPDVPPYDRAEWLPACVWKNVGLEYQDSTDFETGQFMIDKSKCWNELDLAMWMNEHSDYFYKFVFGDKSTFHLAWRVYHSYFAMPQRLPGGNAASLLQFDFTGRILFQHCTRNKPDIYGYPNPGAMIHRTQCLTHLEELRGVWSGKLWDNPDPTPEERAIITAVEGRTYTYERSGIDSRPMKFLEDGRIGKGMARMEVSYAVATDDGDTLMVISDIDDVPTAVLRRDGDGWEGEWLRHERCKCRLTPEGT